MLVVMMGIASIAFVNGSSSDIRTAKELMKEMESRGDRAPAMDAVIEIRKEEELHDIFIRLYDDLPILDKGRFFFTRNKLNGFNLEMEDLAADIKEGIDMYERENEASITEGDTLKLQYNIERYQEIEHKYVETFKEFLEDFKKE